MIAATAPTLASFPQDHPCWRLHNKDAQVITATTYMLLSRLNRNLIRGFQILFLWLSVLHLYFLLGLEGFEGPIIHWDSLKFICVKNKYIFY